jgi:hypothetical protein
MSAKGIASLAIFWAMAQQIRSFMVGDYVAGRMRSQWHDATQHEAEFRDDLHGGLVWAVGILVGATLVMATAGVAAKTGAEVAGKAAASVASSTGDAMHVVLDTMLRTETAAQATAPTSPSPEAASSGATPRSTASSANETRAEMSRILASAVASGSMRIRTVPTLPSLCRNVPGCPNRKPRNGSMLHSMQREQCNARSSRQARRAAILTGFMSRRLI